MEDLVINLIRLLCPYLRAMADKTGSQIDDIVVNIICSLVATKSNN